MKIHTQVIRFFLVPAGLQGFFFFCTAPVSGRQHCEAMQGVPPEGRHLQAWLTWPKKPGTQNRCQFPKKEVPSKIQGWEWWVCVNPRVVVASRSALKRVQAPSNFKGFLCSELRVAMCPSPPQNGAVFASKQSSLPSQAWLLETEAAGKYSPSAEWSRVG